MIEDWKPAFKIEQLALHPTLTNEAMSFLYDIGLNQWSVDNVVASGQVFSVPASNTATLAFNYQASDPDLGRPLELELLHYTDGANWMQQRGACVSHLGMHCTEEELDHWRDLMKGKGIHVAQEVVTESHTNPVIAGKRNYRYVIFSTRHLIGVDLKFIVRLDPQLKG